MWEILAQTPSPGDIPFLDYLDLGVLAVLVFAIIKGWFVTGRERDALAADKELERLAKQKAEEKFETYQMKVQDEILPQLFETTRVLGEVMDMITKLSKTQEQHPPSASGHF